jgi:hypothetical protein
VQREGFRDEPAKTLADMLRKVREASGHGTASQRSQNVIA